MDKWEKIEEFINQLIEKLMSFFTGKASSVTPSKIKEKVQNGKELLTTRRGELKEKIVKGKDAAIHSVVQAKGKIDETKVKAAQLVVKAKQTNIKEIKPAKVYVGLAAFLAPPLLKFKSWYLSIKPAQLASFISLSTVASLATVTIYVQSNKIAEKSRAPASELTDQVEKATAISRRPAYYKRKEKQFKVTNIVLPAYANKKGPVRKLVIDFTFESTNKYIKNYLWQNPHLIQDTLNSKIEPITITFPLEEEGKIIVKEKIMKEMNKRLKSMKIKGKIKNVYIHSMIAG